MNDEYTPEDFANARFAEHTDGRIAMRAEPETGIPWYVGDDQIKRLDAVMARDGWRPVREHAPLTLDTLREAYETAERVVPDSPIRPGDVVIHPTFGGYYVGRVEGDADRLNTRGDVRVLNRAPQPEPWQALADVLGTNSGELIGEHHSITEVAKALHDRGVRVTGGDEA